MSYNVFADMGLPNPEEELTKARLVHSLGQVLSENGMTTAEAAQHLQLDPAAFSELLEGVWDDYSPNDLSRFAALLNSYSTTPEESKTPVLTA